MLAELCRKFNNTEIILSYKFNKCVKILVNIILLDERAD